MFTPAGWLLITGFCASLITTGADVTVTLAVELVAVAIFAPLTALLVFVITQ
jgi:hypothetical protein